MLSWMYSNFGLIGRRLTKLPALEDPKYPHWVKRIKIKIEKPCLTLCLKQTT